MAHDAAHPSPVHQATDDEALLEQFELTLAGGGAPRIEDFLKQLPAVFAPADRRTVLAELIRIELDYRWRPEKRSTVPPPRIVDYLQRFPDLRQETRELIELVGEEYEVRCHWDRRPDHGEYAAQFPQLGQALRSHLARLDGKLAREFAPRPQPVAVPPPPSEVKMPPAAPPGSVTALVELLRRHELLDQKTLNEAVPKLQRQLTDPRALARELLRLGWLTPYQLNEIFRGHAEELVLGPYRVLERLGEGGTGKVFKARHRQLDRTAAVKLIRPELIRDAEVLGRFYREVQVLGQLTHPNIVHAYDAGPIGQTHFLAMEFVEGTDLDNVVRKSGRLPVGLACDYIVQAARGLAYVHEKGLIHRDIKPPNLLVTAAQGARPGGVVKILDLGLARLREPAKAPGSPLAADAIATRVMTPIGSVMMGTPDYMAPEQALDFHTADIRADIYSLGCSLCFLLTGQPPFPGGTLAQKLLRHQQAAPLDIRKLRPEVPPALIAVIGKMLAKRPDDRYQTPGELAEALAPFAGLETSTGLRFRKLRKLLARRRWLGFTGAGMLVLVLLLLLGGLPARKPGGTPGGVTGPGAGPFSARPIITAGNSDNIAALRVDGTCLYLNNALAVDVKGWNDLIQVEAGYDHVVGLRRDGTCVAVGPNRNSPALAVQGWRDIVAVSAGYSHTVGLKADGTILQAGINLTSADAAKVSGWKDIVAISAGSLFTIVVRKDGTCAAVGLNSEGQCEVAHWRDIITVATTGHHTLGLRSNGTVVVTDCRPSTDAQKRNHAETPIRVGDWSNVIDIDATHWQVVGLRADSTVLYSGDEKLAPAEVAKWRGVVAVGCGRHAVLGVKPDGSLLAVGSDLYQSRMSVLSSWNLGSSAGISGPRVPRGRSYREPWPR
ncbi:MAG: protein kinase [Planctomycetia bacterium]|nr:protein kinase [Planctomycetia bacterium]